jgi:uncharacterized membrane protein (DUF2068 family)
MTGQFTARIGSGAVVRCPLALPAVAGLVGLQGLGLVGVAVFYLVELAVATTSDVAVAVVTAALALAWGAGLLLVARGLLRGGRWARSPAVVTNALIFPVAVDLLRGGRWYIGAPLLLWALAVVVLLFSRPVSAALDD